MDIRSVSDGQKQDYAPMEFEDVESEKGGFGG